MKKTLYSLMLTDDVVHEVDALAHRRGTNRSNLVNQILAEYVGYATPERRINDIFSQIALLLGDDRELVPYVTPNALSMSLKSSLQYRYRPTVKYSVELYRSYDRSLGELTVTFRTQSAELLAAMERFFRLWKQTEDRLAAPLLSAPAEYALYGGRFTRTLSLPARRDYTAEELAQAISAYVRFFDSMMKAYLAGGLNGSALAAEYDRWLLAGNLPL